jgi:hypothetical protein
LAEHGAVNSGVPGSSPGGGVMEKNMIENIRGDVTWGEQFGYIWMCIKEIIKMQISGDNYQPPV